MNEEKKKIRKEYLKLQNKLTEFIEYHATDMDGWEDGLILSPEDKKEYDALVSKIAKLKEKFREI